MEEAWELAAVSGNGLSDQTVEFIKLNEFALRYHLHQLEKTTHDFDIHYQALEEYSRAKSKCDLNTDQVWDSLDRAMNDCFHTAQTLEPAIKRSRSKASQKFTELRGELLAYFLGLDAEGASELKEIRNRMIHFDEDFDDWYMKVAKEGFRDGLRLIQRALFWDEVELHVQEQGVLMGYDIKTGVFHTLGDAMDIHSLCIMMRTVRDNIPLAHSRLTKLAKNKTELMTL